MAKRLGSLSRVFPHGTWGNVGTATGAWEGLDEWWCGLVRWLSGEGFLPRAPGGLRLLEPS